MDKRTHYLLPLRPLRSPPQDAPHRGPLRLSRPRPCALSPERGAVVVFCESRESSPHLRLSGNHSNRLMELVRKILTVVKIYLIIYLINIYFRNREDIFPNFFAFFYVIRPFDRPFPPIFPLFYFKVFFSSPYSQKQILFLIPISPSV